MTNQNVPDRIIFVLTIDTEEEFDWDGPFPEHNWSVENTKHIPALQVFCESLGIKPTYLVDYPVAATPESAAMLKQLVAAGKAEVGAHLHPWCTPPFEGPNTERESHVVNLRPDLALRKLDTLVSMIESRIGERPVSFRTGRWGINSAIIKILADNGFTTDSSIYPFYENKFFSCINAHNTPYWPSLDDPDKPGSQRRIFELPVTAGFNRPNFRFWSRAHVLLSKRILRFFRPIGIAWKTKLLKKIYLSPELSNHEDMISLVDAALAEGHQIIHMYFHSSSLLNIQPDIHSGIEAVIRHLQTKASLEFMTLSEASHRLGSQIAIQSNPLSERTS